MLALELANEIRSRRSQLKRDLKAGRADMLAMIIDPPEWIETMKLFDLILATPKWGRVKVNKILAQARVSPSKTIGGLSDRQRGELTALLKHSTTYRLARVESGR